MYRNCVILCRRRLDFKIIKLLKKYYKEKILSSSQAIQQGVKDICKKNLKY